MNRQQKTQHNKKTEKALSPNALPACEAIIKAAVFHRAGQEYRYATSGGQVNIRLRAATKNLSCVELFYGNRYDNDPTPECSIVKMEKTLCDGISDWYEAAVCPRDPRLFYFFKLTGHGTNPEIAYMQESGFFSTPTFSNRNEFFFFPYIQDGDIHSVPDWTRGALIYQIFPDRYYRFNGQSLVKPPNGTAMKRWGSAPQSGKDFYGGNLKGIQEKLPYIASLGVSVLYLTPVFRSLSSHRYDTDDYYEIDPMLGTKQDLKDLADELHKLGIKLVIDAVFNHCGPNFFAFKDVLEKADKSRYRDWFFIEGYPVDVKKKNYATFASASSMPKLNAANPEVAEYFCDVGRFWIREAGIDGWRIDVANEVDTSFWRKFRTAVKSVNPDAAIIGEIWGDSQFWLGGDMFDSVMHYPFTFPIKAHLAAKATSIQELDHRLNRIAALYTHTVRDALWTMLDSHDTERFITAAKGDKLAARMAAFLQFTFPGSPMIYYGAEIGMEGGNDPDCRRCMEWAKANEDNDFLEYYKKLSSARKSIAALRTGSFRTLSAEKGVYAFLRAVKGSFAVAILNTNSTESEIVLALPEEYFIQSFSGSGFLTDFLGGATVGALNEAGLPVSIAAASTAILVRKDSP